MTNTLLALQDPVYRDFQRRLIPNLDADTIIGVRTPELRRLAEDVDAIFRSRLPHRYFEENQIHAFSLDNIRSFDLTVREVERFLPYVDNWATCDQLRPKVFCNHKQDLLPHIRRWLMSDHPYTIRFGMEMLMCHYMDDAFDPEYPQLIAEAVTEHYYVRMMAAWYFATALAKQYDSVISYIADYRLPAWVHNKTIQKAVESNRVSARQKDVLKQYRIK